MYINLIEVMKKEKKKSKQLKRYTYVECILL